MDENEHDRLPGDAAPDPLMPPGGVGVPTDPGGYIGREPELARQTIPGGAQRGDARVAAVASRPTGVGADDAGEPEESRGVPNGHRRRQADDVAARGAGQDR